jgi:hypothetical protein
MKTHDWRERLDSFCWMLTCMYYGTLVLLELWRFLIAHFIILAGFKLLLWMCDRIREKWDRISTARIRERYSN